VDLLHQFTDRALQTIGISANGVRRFTEGDGLLCAIPLDTPTDRAVELLPEMLCKQLARHNRTTERQYRLSAVMSFTIGPSEEARDRLVGPGRDVAVGQADLPAIRSELEDAEPGTVVAVIDSGLFHSYVVPELGHDLTAKDFTKVPGGPPVWFHRFPDRSTTGHKHARHATRWNVDVRRVLALVLVALLLASGLVWWTLRDNGDVAEGHDGGVGQPQASRGNVAPPWAGEAAKAGGAFTQPAPKRVRRR
jgi:hypothetical protein